MFTDSQCLCSFQIRPSISRPAGLEKLTCHHESDHSLVSQFTSLNQRSRRTAQYRMVFSERLYRCSARCCCRARTLMFRSHSTTRGRLGHQNRPVTDLHMCNRLKAWKRKSSANCNQLLCQGHIRQCVNADTTIIRFCCTMDTVDTAAPKVDLQHEQDLAGIVQSSQFLSILIALATLLFTLGTAMLVTTTESSNVSDTVRHIGRCRLVTYLFVKRKGKCCTVARPFRLWQNHLVFATERWKHTQRNSGIDARKSRELCIVS